MKELIFVCFVIHLRGLVSADNVPVIIWGPHVQHESAIAVKSHCGFEFLNILQKHSTVDTITFVVVEDQLSVEDFSHCKAPNGRTCFHGIQSIETKLYLPTVKYPAYAIEDLTLGRGESFEINLNLSSGNHSESLKNRSGNYVFINFGDNNYTNETISQRLTRHDQMITSFYKKFLSQNHRRIVVVFTGKRDANHMRFSREVSMPFTYSKAQENSTNSTDSTNFTDSTNSSKPTTGYVWKTESVLLHYISLDLAISNEHMWMNVTNITVNASKGTNTRDAMNDAQELHADYGETVEGDQEITETKFSTENETSNGTNATIVHRATSLFVTISVNEADVFKFAITTAKGYWWAYQFTWNDEPLFSNRPISAPNGFSYHCTPAITLTNKNETAQNGTATENEFESYDPDELESFDGDDPDETQSERNRTEIVITWNGLQLQPKFVYVEGKMLASFSDAYDCVGFVSIGILSGLFVVFLLVFILFIGILCIMDIKPIDRFEDPKGPRMTFTVSE